MGAILTRFNQQSSLIVIWVIHNDAYLDARNWTLMCQGYVLLKSTNFLDISKYALD